MLPRFRAHVLRSPWRRRATTLAATFIVAGGLTVLPASATSLTYTVCSDATYTTIAGAITAAAAAVGSTSDDVTITICADTYAESGLDLSGGGAIGILTLQTAGDGQVIVNETGSDKSDSIFEIGQAGGISTMTVTIAGAASSEFLLQNACHALYVYEGSDLSLDHVVVQDNTCDAAAAAAAGAGIYAEAPGGDIHITASTFEDNEVVDGSGGAIYSEDPAFLYVESSTFTTNRVRDGADLAVAGDNRGGAVAVVFVGASGPVPVTLVDSSFDANYVEADAATSGATGVGDGGAVFAQNADVLVSGGAVSFTDNDADRHGGAMYVDGLLGVQAFHDDVDYDTASFVGNTAGSDGGAIYLADEGRTVGYDALGYMFPPGIRGTDLDPEALLFQGNAAGRSGGAIAVVAGAGALVDPLFYATGAAFYANAAGLDSSTGGGGALYTGQGVEVDLVSSWFGWPFDPGATLPEYLIEPTGGWVGETDYGTPLTWPDSGNTAICDTCTVNAGGGAVLVMDASAGDGFDACDSETSGPAFAWNATEQTGTNPLENMGGAIQFREGGTPDNPSARFFCGYFVSNAAAEGGAIYAAGETEVTIGFEGSSFFGGTFLDNAATTAGGAIRTTNGTLKVFNGTFEGNTTIASNGGGGAIYAAGIVETTDASFVGNLTGAVGGAIVTGNYATLTRSLFSDNQSGQHGGAVYTDDGMEAFNSTFTQNEILGTGADDSWHGAAIIAGGDIELTHVTVAQQGAGNAKWDGSVLYANGDLRLTNSIVDEATGDPRCVGANPYDLGGNIVTAACGAPFGTGVASAVATSAEIALGSLADNGGLTETMALGSDSAAIDVVAVDGSSQCAALGDDQRGFFRPYSDAPATPCDAGAYEARYTTTSSEVSSATVAAGETVDDDVTVDGYLDASGLIDPQGSVQFSYCFDAAAPPVWGVCTPTDIGTPVALTPTAIGAGSSVAGLTGWDPAATADGDGPGYYLFHAEYLPHATGDDTAPEPSRYLGSEDDGTNEAFTYDVSTSVATTTTTRVSRSEITFGQSIRDVATVTADEGTDDPTGDVVFTYCYVGATPAPAGETCTPTTVGTVTLSGGTDTADGTSTAQSGLVTLPGAGYYVFHAEYLGDDGFDPSEDDGTNESVYVAKAPTLIDLTSGTYFAAGGTISLTGTLTAPAGCLSGRLVTFKLDGNGDGVYETTIGTATSVSSGAATYSPYTTTGGSIYEIELSTDETENCLGTVNTATIVVAGSGDAANGGGHYTNGGRINFGFTVQKKTNTKTGAVTITGQMTWHKQGGNRLKGSITAYTTIACPTGVSATCALLTGTASYYRWDGAGGKWTLVSTGVGFRVTIADGGVVTTCVKKTCTTSNRADSFAMDVPSLTVAGESPAGLPLYQLKGGSILIK